MLRVMIPLVCIVALLLPIVAGVSKASDPEMWLWGYGVEQCAGYDRVHLWMDQPDFMASVCSSEAISAFGLVSEVANDFLIEIPVTVRKVNWWGVYWNGFEGTPVCAGFLLRFYIDADCLPETHPFLEFPLLRDSNDETLAEGADGYSQFQYDFCLDLALEPGHYWLSVQAMDHAFPPQCGRLGSCRPLPLICKSCIRSEYFGQPEWVPLHDVLGMAYGASQMLEDECVPTPTENASWGAVRGLYR